MTALPAPVAPLPHFEAASRAVLDHVAMRLGLHAVAVTRVVGDAWMFLQARDHHFGLAAGSVLPFSTSICSRMVRGEGPAAAPVLERVPAYRDAPIVRDLGLEAYVGLPLLLSDGSVFGTVCAVSAVRASESLSDELPELELLVRLLGSVLDRELEVVLGQRRTRAAGRRARGGLLSARAFDDALADDTHDCERGLAGTLVLARFADAAAARGALARLRAAADPADAVGSPAPGVLAVSVVDRPASASARAAALAEAAQDAGAAVTTVAREHDEPVGDALRQALSTAPAVPSPRTAR